MLIFWYSIAILYNFLSTVFEQIVLLVLSWIVWVSESGVSSHNRDADISVNIYCSFGVG